MTTAPTKQTPNAMQARPDDKPVGLSSLTVGIICGIIGFLVIIVVLLVVGLKLRRKKKANDDNAICRTSSNSNAKLINDSPTTQPRCNTQNSILQKYTESFSEKRSTSCPDIYNVNQSISLKLGSTAHAYEQLEQSSMSGSVRYKSQDPMAALTMDNLRNSSSSRQLSREEREGRIFDDDGEQLYQIPSVPNTLRTQSDAFRTPSGNSPSPSSDTYRSRSVGKIPPRKNSNELLLIVGDNKIPLQLAAHSNPVNKEDDGYSVSYQIPSTPSSPEIIAQENNEIEFSSYLTPTSNSPKLLPKTEISSKNDLGYTNEDIYDHPKHPNTADSAFINTDSIYSNSDSIYTNLPGRESLGYRGNNNNDNIDEKYKVPIRVLNTTKTKLNNNDDRLYNVPSNNNNTIPRSSYPSETSSYHSQTSLGKTSNDSPRYSSDSSRDIFGRIENDDTIYDIPSRSQTLERSKLPSYESRVPSTDSRISNDIRNDENYINIDVLRNSKQINKINFDVYDGDRNNPRDSNYDIPNTLGSTSSSTDESLSSSNMYRNVDSSTLEKRRSAGLVKKIGYDVPNTIPVFDPSQPSLLKLASKNLYKNKESSPHYSKKISGATATAAGGGGKATLDDIDDYDPSQAFTRAPVNKKLINQGNRSKIYSLEENDVMIYDVPNKKTTSQYTPTSEKTTSQHTPSSENSMRMSGHVGEYGDEDIYQNVYHTEDGKPHLRTYNTFESSEEV